MKLLLMRHAEASERAATDAQRRLTEEGMAAVIRQSNNTAPCLGTSSLVFG